MLLYGDLAMNYGDQVSTEMNLIDNEVDHYNNFLKRLQCDKYIKENAENQLNVIHENVFESIVRTIVKVFTAIRDYFRWLGEKIRDLFLGKLCKKAKENLNEDESRLQEADKAIFLGNASDILNLNSKGYYNFLNNITKELNSITEEELLNPNLIEKRMTKVCKLEDDALRSSYTEGVLKKCLVNSSSPLFLSDNDNYNTYDLNISLLKDYYGDIIRERFKEYKNYSKDKKVQTIKDFINRSTEQLKQLDKLSKDFSNIKIEEIAKKFMETVKQAEKDFDKKATKNSKYRYNNYMSTDANDPIESGIPKTALEGFKKYTNFMTAYINKSFKNYKETINYVMSMLNLGLDTFNKLYERDYDKVTKKDKEDIDTVAITAKGAKNLGPQFMENRLRENVKNKGE